MSLPAKKERQNHYPMIAVAVRDNTDLFLFLTIVRSARGDVYVNFPRNDQPNWKPHSSFHASGQHHQKSFGHRAFVNQKQKPNAEFVGSENVVTTGIAFNEPRSINVNCNPKDFQSVFEIPLSDLRPEMYGTFVSVDVTAPNAMATFTPGAVVIRSESFKDAVPWILITLFDSMPLVG